MDEGNPFPNKYSKYCGVKYLPRLSWAQRLRGEGGRWAYELPEKPQTADDPNEKGLLPGDDANGLCCDCFRLNACLVQGWMQAQDWRRDAVPWVDEDAIAARNGGVFDPALSRRRGRSGLLDFPLVKNLVWLDLLEFPSVTMAKVDVTCMKRHILLERAYAAEISSI